MWEMVRLYFDTAMPILIVAATVLVGYGVRRIIIARLMRWASKTETAFDDIIVDAIKRPFMIWALMLGLYFALVSSHLPDQVVHIISTTLLVLGVLSVTFVLSHIAARSIQAYANTISTALPVTSLTQHVSRIVIFGIGILIILNILGISITPILATLGVGGLAVALALQETLSNLFAGFHIIMARQIKVGDYIKIASGDEGYISDITWRTTKIRTLTNNEILVPNDALIKATIINYHMPDKETAVTVPVGVHYDSDLTKVETVTCEVAAEVMKTVTGGVPAFVPSLRYGGFGDSAITLTVGMRAREFADQYLIKHEFIKRLHARYRKEGIVIPYPTRSVFIEKEKEGGAR